MMNWDYCKTTAKKEHKCSRCDKVIPKGYEYFNPRMRFYNYHFCSVECIENQNSKRLSWF